MNSTRGSTPPNPNLDLPNCSTDLNKTLGIIGTPHEESIAKIHPTKTCRKRRNRRNLAKNTSNPRTRKPQNRAPLLRDLGGESQLKEPRRVPTNFPHQIPKRKVPKTTQENTKKGLRKSPPRTTGNYTKRPRGTTPNHLYKPQRFIHGLACRSIIQPSQQDLTM
jgi:hypothetical protein